jgi:hypothetical protein
VFGLYSDVSGMHPLLDACVHGIGTPASIKGGRNSWPAEQLSDNQTHALVKSVWRGLYEKPTWNVEARVLVLSWSRCILFATTLRLHGGPLTVT